MIDVYTQSVIPLTYSRSRNGTFMTGLSVSVSVVNTATDATLLASTTCTENQSGSGIYSYNWTHNLVQDTACTVIYTVSGSKYLEFILVSMGGLGGRAV